MVVAHDIKKNYGKLEVLKGIDLEIQKGEIITIVGKSGAGKSTLLHILGTLDTPDSGSLEINGTKVKFSQEKDLAKLRNRSIGFVFQFHHLLYEFSALENVCIPAYIFKNKDSVAVEKRAKELLDYLGLADRIHHKPNELSGGEAQRVAIARALINQPELVLADEPTGNLDKHNSEELHNLFLQLRKDFGQSFVIVTHNSELAAMSDRTVTMEDGKIIS